MLNFALHKGYVESIPGTLHITMPTVDNRVTENITPEQAQKLLQALDEETDQVLTSLVPLALFTGVRHGALLNLQRYAHLHDDALRKASSVAGTLFSQVREQVDSPGSQKSARNTTKVKVRKKQKES